MYDYLILILLGYFVYSYTSDIIKWEGAWDKIIWFKLILGILMLGFFVIYAIRVIKKLTDKEAREKAKQEKEEREKQLREKQGLSAAQRRAQYLADYDEITDYDNLVIDAVATDETEVQPTEAETAEPEITVDDKTDAE